MKKIVRFTNMTVVIPIKDGETVEEIEDRLTEFIKSAGSRFTGYTIEVEEESDGLA